MPQVTLHFPDLAEHANQNHPELKKLVQNFSDAEKDMFAAAASWCETWVDPEFAKLLAQLEHEGQLPEIKANIDASHDSKRIVKFAEPEDGDTADARATFKRAWAATVDVYASALYYRAYEIAAGEMDPRWIPDRATDGPTI